MFVVVLIFSIVCCPVGVEVTSQLAGIIFFFLPCGPGIELGGKRLHLVRPLVGPHCLLPDEAKLEGTRRHLIVGCLIVCLCVCTRVCVGL